MYFGIQHILVAGHLPTGYAPYVGNMAW